jgi:membrane-bound lytic murein transglycosylase B
VLDGNTELPAFIQQMAEKHGFDPVALATLFQQVTIEQKILDAISRPAEAKPWHQYWPIFLTEARIREGVTFWEQNRAALERAEQEFGVPQEMIVAILGVETRYGRHTGGYRVLDALATLAFAYPPRAAFFRGELEQYLLLAREEGLDPLSVRGSYAGAMGQAQFIASSYRRYAVDFSGDGKRDLWGDTQDAIGSVANYFKQHQWQRGGAITLPALAGGGDLKAMVQKGLKPHTTVAQLRQQNVFAADRVEPQALAALIELQTAFGVEYWLGLQNFYVITRYNRSPLYAMAAYQLGQAIVSERQRTDATARAGGRQ